MKPLIERVAVAPGQSWTLLNRRLDGGIPFEWHHHPEYELTLTLNSKGQRFVGDHVEAYDHGDLVLLGPNLPHTWASSGRHLAGEPHVALVMWFRPEWIDGLTEKVVELAALKPMLSVAGRGIRYSDTAATVARPVIEAMPSLAPAKRLLALLDVLLMLSEDGGRSVLARADRRQRTIPESDRPRIERVLDHVHRHYRERQTIQGLSEIAHLSPSGFQRLFQRHIRMSVLDYLAQLRIGMACQLLISTSRPIAHVAADVGYDNLSHFNRQFRTLKGATPRAFRSGFNRG